MFVTNTDVYTRDKMSELGARIHQCDELPQIIALQEVKPKHTRYERTIEEYNIEGYEAIGKNLSNDLGRGMLLYIRKDIRYNEVNLLSTFSEYICIEIIYEGGKMILLSVYRSPSSDKDNNDLLLSLMEEVCALPNEYKVIVGDFNLPHINWDKCHTSEGTTDINYRFLEKIRDCYLTQHVIDTTRFRGDVQGNVLDLILTNDETIIEKVIVESPLGKSDHACILFKCDLRELVNHGKRVIHKYEKGNYNLMKQKLNMDWTGYLLEEDNIEVMWEKFKTKLHLITDECIPKVTVNDNRTQRKRMNKNLPMNRKLWRQIKKKQRLWEQVKKMKRDENRNNDRYREVQQNYRRVNNQIRSETRKAVKNNERDIAKNVKENPKLFWKYVQAKTRTKSRIPELVDQVRGIPAQSDQEKAEVLAKQFSEVFVREPEGEVPEGIRRDVQPLINFEITEEKIRNALQNLKRNKSPGPDHIHPRVLKEVMEELVEPLKIIFRKSFETGILPTDWKVANITAIFKKGERSDPGNYRPVSLTSVVCKLMETLLREEIILHMKENNLFSKKQYGFISGRSTALQLITVLDKWTEALDEGKAVDVVYCDFQKAFDRVPHKRLMEKIQCCGIEGNYLKWIENFLMHRKQRVVVNGKESCWSEVISGVPQGSVLGPLLFVIFINDLPECIKNRSELYLYADDTKIFRTIENTEDCEDLQKDLLEMKKWTDKWLLSFHPDKSKYMRIGKSDVGEGHYYLDKQIQKTSSEKDIGVMIDEKLHFSEHISEKINKANRIAGLIRRTFITLDEKMFKPLYTTLVRPHLEYANQVWNPHLMKDIKAIENVQRRATRLLPGMAGLSYEERLRKLDLPSLSYRRSRGDMIETFKILSGRYDSDCCEDVFRMRQDSVTRGHSRKIYKPRSRLNLRKYSFPCRVVDNWNNLPESVVSSENVHIFERRLDNFWKGEEQKFNYKAHMSITRCQHNPVNLEPQALL